MAGQLRGVGGGVKGRAIEEKRGGGSGLGLYGPAI